MKPSSLSEKLFLEEVTAAAQKLKAATKGLSIGSLIKSIRVQLGMSQKVLAHRAGMPQSTVSRIETAQSDLTLSTLNKLLCALSCDLVMAPLLQTSIDDMRQKQARKLAKEHTAYLQGTMNMEGQQPDARFVEELIKREEERLLHGSGTQLWAEQ